jgi:uroporphyrinogen decarboxylase
MVRTMSDTARRALLQVLAGESLTPPPVWLMRQAGRYLPEYRELRSKAKDFLGLCYSPALAAEVTLQPIRRYGLDAAILFSDILVVPDALGQSVTFREGEGPVLGAIRDSAGLAALSLVKVRDRLGPVYETVERVRAALPEEVTLIGFAGAPWTVATYMVEGGSSKDFAATKGWAYREPAEFDRLIELVVEASVQYLEGQVEAGVDCVQLFDTWAGALPAELYDRLCIRPTATIVARLKDRYPELPVIGFPRGSGLNYERYARETGIDGLGIDSGVPLDWARDTLQPICAVQGNLDPLALVTGGSVLDQGIERILNGLGGGPLIFNLGHGVIPATPPEHVAALLTAVRKGA